MKKDMHSPFEVLISVGATLGWEVRFSNPPVFGGVVVLTSVGATLGWEERLLLSHTFEIMNVLISVGATLGWEAYSRHLFPFLHRCFNLRWSDVGVGRPL